MLAAEDQSGIRLSHKAIINVFLPGGPPHLDMWDIKPEAPREIRGEFNPIKTNVPGIEICEHFPRIARWRTSSSFIRSLVGCSRRPRRLPVHDRPQEDRRQPDYWPAMGAWVSKVQGAGQPGRSRRT